MINNGNIYSGWVINSFIATLKHKKKPSVKVLVFKWWPQPGLNRRHMDFQSDIQ